MVQSTQQQYRLVKAGSAFSLSLAGSPIPEPGPNEALVRIRAVSLNRRDILIRDGQYGIAMHGANFVPCSDAAGDVVAVGAGTARVATGDRVVTVFTSGWLTGKRPPEAAATSLGDGGLGVLTQYIVVNEEGLFVVPSSLSYAAAATLPCAGVTAWNALIALGRLAPGETVLVQGTGGVSLFALQIAIASGASVIVISSSDEKLELCRALGASATLNYRETPDWGDAVRALTNGRGVDQVVEVGGEATLISSFAALASGGHVAIVGGLGGFPEHVPGFPLILLAARVSGVAVGSRDHLDELATFLDAHATQPVIDRIFPFEDARQAYDRMDDPSLFGKVVISV